MIVKFLNIYGFLENTIFSKCYSFDIYEEYTIHTLKCIIHEYFEYDVDTLQLSITGVALELENDKTLKDYKDQIEGNAILMYGTLNCNDKFNTTYIPSNSSVPHNTIIKQQILTNEQVTKMLKNLHEQTDDDIAEVLYEYPYLLMVLLTSYTGLIEKFCQEIPNYMLSVSVEDITHIIAVAHIFKEIGEELNLPDDSRDLDMVCLTREDYNNIMDIKKKLQNIEDSDIEIIVKVYIMTHKNKQLTTEFLE
mgnify:CR=1 FL=1